MTLPESPDDAWQVVRQDVEDAFGAAFPGELVPVEPFETDLLITSGPTVAVPWRWIGHHERPFAGIHPAGTEVVVTGVTMLRDGPEGELVFHRLVDWHALYTQLGATIGNRSTLDRRDVATSAP
jgi:hypothetical protein